MDDIADDDPILIDIVNYSNKVISDRENEKGNSRTPKKKVVDKIATYIQQAMDKKFSGGN